MQYSTGTVQVTNGSAVVYMNGAINWAGVNPGAAFGVQGEGIFYTVLQYAAPDHIVLTSPYRGVTNASAPYVICNDFTPNLGLPLINRGDLETATIFDLAMIKLESTYSGQWGDMFKTVYDKNNNGIVDAAESVPWLGITGRPTTFPPSPHAPTHLTNGSDPIPLASATASGFVPPTGTGSANLYLNSALAWVDPTLQLQSNFMTKAVYDHDQNGVVDTCDALAWGKLTGVPPNFVPSLHAPTHLDNGADPIPAVTTTRMGLVPILSGTVTQFLDGTGHYSVPVGQPLHVLGTVPTAPSGLPPTGNPGDVWIAADTGHIWSWNGTTWVDCGQSTVGPPGPQGNPGATGQPAWTTNTVAFAIPAVGQSVQITVTNASWMTPGENVWVAGAAGGGNAAAMKIVSVNTATNQVVLYNPPSTVGTAGPPGVAGPPGMTWRGVWSPTVAYAVNDAVEINGDTYICVVANTGSQPTFTNTNWNILAQGGSNWWNGHGPPGTITGAVPGDYYLDVDSGLSYVLS